ncbi:MAG TPA: hypothetical protein VJ914_06370 [Pseudonocardiaceae bacterium]|nr:hypothetical protein [Pseudonocardiaceae bacterium]
MDEGNWARLPVGIDARQWLTRSTTRTVLVAVHTIVAGHRLLDIVDLIESDPRIQVVFTAAPEVFDADVPLFLRRIGAAVIPWQQATRERFDLALAASCSSIARLHAPVLVLPHGAGYGKRAPSALGPVYGLDRTELIAEGRVLPASIVLSHRAQLDLLAAQCPPALPVAVVAGDPCYDRLCASLPRRDAYRAALGIKPDQEFVVATTTWGSGGLFGRFPDIVADLPHSLDRDRYRVAALLHPAIWAHGGRQLRAWLARACAAGLMLVEPTQDWRGALIAADHVIGDQGSVSTYAAAIGRPVRYVDTGAVPTPGSAQEYLRAHAPRWRPGVPIDQQPLPPEGLAEAVRDRLTSCPGESHRRLRANMYRLMDLAEPAAAPVVEPVSHG